MKKLILNEIKLVSLLEKKARKFHFHPKITIIKGENHTGKSSLIKSIYWTFGATPKNLHPNWQKADVISLIDFSIDDIPYSILRKGDFFAIFDEQKNVLGTFDKITSGLGPFLSKLLDYKIKLNNREKELITPPPAYFFLPFYIDQDVSWKENWTAFTNLSQLSNWKPNIINYHTGIKPNEYYEIKANIESIQNKIDELESKKSVSQNVLKKLLDQFQNAVVDIDIKVFKQEIDELMERYKTLKTKGEIARDKIVKLKSQKLQVEKQATIVHKTMQELRKDYEYALEIADSVDCPTCGHTYENSFAERFSIAKDEDKCQDLLIKLKEESKAIDEKIAKEYEEYNKNNKDTSQIKVLLEKRQGEIKLKDVIQHEGKKELRQLLDTEITDLRNDIAGFEDEIKDYKEDLKTIEDKKRQKDIKDKYYSLMKSFLLKLDVHTMSEKSYKSILSSISESGSGLPRALLAYYYSILHTMKKYSTSTFCPIIIDSPNQQDQDEENLKKMMEFIFNEQPEGSQLILGLVELGEFDFEGEVIELTEKYHLLQGEHYEKISKEIRRLLDKSLL
ncbi:chromosome segregation ATPase [Metabacillus malikii]|uniref:Chromosome segregation ATPase n=2 Tax=Metabacillus malikii TaxID=1504265 RepID=A0ABT9Z9D0_9BACI|nr:chromosome segregation ATPase [Metabacillus malikii]